MVKRPALFVLLLACLLLEGVSITSSGGPAVHIKAADKVILTLADGTENTLTDSPEYILPDGEDEPDGALFSRADLSINGTGTLQHHLRRRMHSGKPADRIRARAQARSGRCNCSRRSGSGQAKLPGQAKRFRRRKRLCPMAA